MEEYLSNIYYDINQPSSYTSIEQLVKRSLDDKKKYSRSEIKKWAESQDTISLHKPSRINFKQNTIFVYHIDQQWEIDLSDVSSLRKENNNYRYLCCIIDCLSKYAFVEPLFDKTGNSLVKAFKNVLRKSGRKPINVRGDKGGEIMNRKFISYLKSININFFTSQNRSKAAIIERFQKRLSKVCGDIFIAQVRCDI